LLYAPFLAEGGIQVPSACFGPDSIDARIPNPENPSGLVPVVIREAIEPQIQSNRAGDLGAAKAGAGSVQSTDPEGWLGVPPLNANVLRGLAK
jgi:hypothetical protein